MSSKFKKSVFIFRRDLRLCDNTGLIAACQNSEVVIPIFIFDPLQVEKNEYFSPAAFQFMLQSLTEVDQALRKKNTELFFFSGSSHDVLKDLIQTEKIEAVYVNHDYTPFAKARDKTLEKVCQELGVNFYHYADALLNEPARAAKENGEPYLVFTPFRKNAQLIPVSEPHTVVLDNFYSGTIKKASTKVDLWAKFLPEKRKNLRLQGGRSEALQILKSLNPDYEAGRDFPAQATTTLLSAHHKFGTISIRESYHQLRDFYGVSHTVISELYWRDFFTHIADHFPSVFGAAFQKKFNNLTWENDPSKFQAWCNGQTGFPLVDAGMRELNQTGYMHNRVRMVTASFLVKNLDIDWRWGEKYFAQNLIDYDPAVNNGNWQWAASTGVDAQPFFRIFNPWRQQERFDPAATYIKKWCPELSNVPPKAINKWAEQHDQHQTNYPAPIVNHKTTSQNTKTKYKAAHERQKNLGI